MTTPTKTRERAAYRRVVIHNGQSGAPLDMIEVVLEVDRQVELTQGPISIPRQ